jgi:hypothetical protein
MPRRRRRDVAHQEKPATGLDSQGNKESPFICIFCGNACTHTEFTVRDSKPMHHGCLWNAYCQLRQEKDERENPHRYRLGY